MRLELNGKGPLGRVRDEMEMLRDEIRDGRFQRSMAAITGLSAVVSGAEAFTQHRRGAFSNRLMWTPIWLMPPAAAAAIAAVFDERAAKRLLPAISAVVIADGIIGFIYHLRGIRRMPGGFHVGRYNVVMGPPVFAPLLMCSVGVAGILTGFLQRGRPPRTRRLRKVLLGGGLAALEALLAPGRPARRRSRTPSWAGVARLALAARSARAGGLGRLARGTPQVALTNGALAGGRLQRGLAVTTAALGAVAGGEAYFEHLRGSFNSKWMWTPVLLTPPMVAAAAGAAVSERIARRVLPIASAVTLADGLLGFGLHVRGLDRMPGDNTSNLDFKIAMGPPLFAPLLFSAVGLFGLVSALLRPARHR